MRCWRKRSSNREFAADNHARGVTEQVDPGGLRWLKRHEQEKNLVKWLADMNEDDAWPSAKTNAARGRQANPVRVLELCREAMDIVGKRFESRRVLPARTGAGRRDARNHRRHRQAADQAGPASRPKKLGQGADRHGARRPARHRQEHRHLHARHQRLRGQGHRHRRADRRLPRRHRRIQARRGRPVRLAHAGLRLDEGDDRRRSRTPAGATG